jgi:hypothetical protein
VADEVTASGGVADDGCGPAVGGAVGNNSGLAVAGCDGEAKALNRLEVVLPPCPAMTVPTAQSPSTSTAAAPTAIATTAVVDNLLPCGEGLGRIVGG